MSCGAETEANALMASLMAGEDLVIPEIDLSTTEFELPGGTTNPIYNELEKIGIDSLTSRAVDGSGAFDALMMGVRVHLQEEFDKNRITGAEYAKAYIALTQAAIGGAVQYLLGKDQAYWAAVQGQITAIQGKVQLKTAITELALAHYKARAMKADYALSKLKLSTESINYCIAKFNLDEMLPKQVLQLAAQTARIAKESLLLDAQIAHTNVQQSLTNQQIDQSVAQTSQIAKQTLLVAEQIETARGATSEYRTDGNFIAGSVGKQKELYQQQIESYKRDSEYKAAKIFTDVWSTIFTVSEGVPATQFSNASIDAILTKLKTTNNLV